MVQSFLNPQSVVLIGVSRQSGVGAYNNFEMMVRYGYRGRIYIIHPKVPEVMGQKTYPRVVDLPEIPELAVISVGRERVLPIFKDCTEKGIRCVIIISQGFSDADEHGKELQKQIVEIARKHEMRVMGPNTMGVINAFDSFSTAFVDVPRDPSPSPLSMIVQSGVFHVGFESFTVRFGKGIDIGNGCDVDFVDCLNYFENDPQTRIIAIHMEGMRRGREFLKTAARVGRKKPVIVFKTGRSEAGAKAALSHTGSLVGEDELFDAAFEKAGIIRVRSMIELKAVCQAFLNFHHMTGPNVAVVTATGACGIMTADACEDYGLQLAPFPEEIREKLENPHIPWHHLHNPVDIWPLGMVSDSFVGVLKETFKGLLKDNRVHAAFAIVPVMASPLHEDLQLLAAVREIQSENSERKPLAFWIYGDNVTEESKILDGEPDVACFDSIDETIMGLAGMWRYEKFRKEGTGKEQCGAVSRSAGGCVPLPERGPVVDESAFELLKHYKIPLVPGELTHDIQSAVFTVRYMGYPVVIKIISPQWLHKSDQGGVCLNIGSPAELESKYAALENLFHRKTPDGQLNGILVQKQIRGTELLFGIKQDPQFGPVLVVGMGGVYTEIFKDVARRLAPVNRAEAETMIRSLRIYPILEGIRGQKGVHLPALVDVLTSLSQIALDYPQITELDLNPVLADEHGCRCVDCRIVLG